MCITRTVYGMHDVEVGDGMEEQWVIIGGWCATEGAEDQPTYGVRCGTWEWADVDTDPAVVRRFVDRLNALQPEPCHYADMVLDFIEECAGADL